MAGALSGYTSCFTGEHILATDEDLAYLKRVGKNEAMTAAVRALATFELGLTLWILRRREEAAKAYRRVPEIPIKEGERRQVTDRQTVYHSPHYIILVPTCCMLMMMTLFPALVI